MVCGFTSTGVLLARGSRMLTESFITGTVIMNTISSTSMTSTSGVMLISFMTSSVSSWVPKATSGSLLHRHHLGVAGGADAGAGDEVGVQVMGEAIQLDQHRLVAAHQRVVGKHR